MLNSLGILRVRRQSARADAIRRFPRRTLGLTTLTGLLLGPVGPLLLEELGLISHRAIATDDQVAQHRIIEAEGSFDLVDRILPALDIEQRIVRLVYFLNRIGERAPAPVFTTMDHTATGFDDTDVAVDHGTDLVALIRVDQKHDLVMTHCVSPRVTAARRSGAARSRRRYRRGRHSRGGGWKWQTLPNALRQPTAPLQSRPSLKHHGPVTAARAPGRAVRRRRRRVPGPSLLEMVRHPLPAPAETPA
jgi:hypothetical protein